MQNASLFLEDPRWTTSPPTESYAAGGGCGYFDSALTGTSAENVHDAVFGGTFAGAFGGVKVELHNLVLGQASWRVFESLVFVRLTIDGVTVDEHHLRVTPVLSASGLSEKVTFEIKHDLPASDEARRIVLTVDSAGSAWMFGATEFPSSIEFTPPRTSPPPA